MDFLLCFCDVVVLWIWSGVVVCQECNPLNSNPQSQNLATDLFFMVVGTEICCCLQILLVVPPAFHTVGKIGKESFGAQTTGTFEKSIQDLGLFQYNHCQYHMTTVFHVWVCDSEIKEQLFLKTSFSRLLIKCIFLRFSYTTL